MSEREKRPPEITYVVSEFRLYESADDLPEDERMLVKEAQKKADRAEAVQQIDGENERGKTGAAAQSADGSIVSSVPNTHGMHAEEHAVWDLFSETLLRGKEPKLGKIAVSIQSGHTAAPHICPKCLNFLSRNTGNVDSKKNEEVVTLVQLPNGKVERATLKALTPRQWGSTYSDTGNLWKVMESKMKARGLTWESVHIPEDIMEEMKRMNIEMYQKLKSNR